MESDSRRKIKTTVDRLLKAFMRKSQPHDLREAAKDLAEYLEKWNPTQQEQPVQGKQP